MSDDPTTKGPRMSDEKQPTCQVIDCGKPATFHAFANNATHPNDWGMQTCDGHLSEGMSHLPGQPEPEHWRVFAIATPSGDGYRVDEVA